MSFAIYKPGQGYWTRTMSAVGLAVLALMGVHRLWGLLGTIRIGKIEPIYVQAGVAVVILTVLTLIGYYLLAAKPRVVEFMIATEGEMKKVNWSTRREIVGSTWVVIGLTIFLALLCFLFDSVFQWMFQVMGVLKTAEAS